MDEEIDILINFLNRQSGLDIRTRKKSEEFINARRFYYAMSKEVLWVSTSKAARSIGYNHATGLSHLKRHQNFLDVYPKYRNEYELLKNGFEYFLKKWKKGMKIKWNFTFEELCVLVKYFQKFEYSEFTGNKSQRVMLSAVRDIGLRLRKKHIDLDYKNSEADNKLSIQMPYHEAYFIEEWLSELIDFCDNDFDSNVIMMMHVQLNQKIV